MKALMTVSRMWSDIHYADFTDSLVQAMLFTQKTLCKSDEFINYDWATYSWHAGARNQLVERAEGDYLFQTDCDHSFAPDAIARLWRIMHKENVSIVSGIYQYKAGNSGHGPVAGFWDTDGRLTPLVDWDRGLETLDVGAVGGGCLLVKTELFRRMRARFKCEPFDQIGGISEDFSFCKRAVEMGERVVLCPQVQSHHIIRSLLATDMYPKQSGGTKVVSVLGGVILPAST